LSGLARRAVKKSSGILKIFAAFRPEDGLLTERLRGGARRSGFFSQHRDQLGRFRKFSLARAIKNSGTPIIIEPTINVTMRLGIANS